MRNEAEGGLQGPWRLKWGAGYATPVAVLLLLTAVAGCGVGAAPRVAVHGGYLIAPPTEDRAIASAGDLVGVAGGIAEDLEAALGEGDRGAVLGGGAVVLVTTFVDVTSFQATSGFGRMLGEMVLSQLQRTGFTVTELRRGERLRVVDGGGEYLLSRVGDQLASSVPAEVAVVGTYAVAYDRVVINTRMVSLRDNRVLSTSAREAALDRNVAVLLRSDEEQLGVDVVRRSATLDVERYEH